ncbi:MAG: hypothetical protein RJQ09_11165 [Cyclobacteriaceae bacterium]
MSYEEKLIALTSEDRKKLSKNFAGAGIFAVFSGVVFYFMLTLTDGQGADFFQYVIYGFIVFFAGIVLFLVISSLLDIQSGNKLSIVGVVTDKEVHRSRSSGKNKTTKVTYYLYFGDKKMRIDGRYYHGFNVGDKVDFHKGKHSGTTLGITVLERSGKALADAAETKPKSISDLADSFRNKSVQSDSSAQIKQFPLTQEDIKILLKTRNSKVFSNVLMIFFFGAFLLGTSFGALFEWFFAIPAFIFLIVEFFIIKAIFKCFSKFSSDKASQEKAVTIAKITNKERSSGRGQAFSVTAGGQTIQVTGAAYNEMDPGEEVFIFRGKTSNWLIGYQIKEKGFIPAK